MKLPKKNRGRHNLKNNYILIFYIILYCILNRLYLGFFFLMIIKTKIFFQISFIVYSYINIIYYTWLSK